MFKFATAAALASALASTSAWAGDFDSFGFAAPQFVPIDPEADLVFELGASVGPEPSYPGASTYEPSYGPIVGLKRLNIPGLIDIGGDDKDKGGLSFSPSIDITSARNSADHDELAGLDDVGATYSAGARFGYEVPLAEAISAEIFGQVRYGVGAAEGLLGEAGVELTAQLTPQLEITGGPMVSFASDNYMDAYFGVTPSESARTGGRLRAYDPSGGIKSAGISISARYEFTADTFLNLEASYSRFVGTAADSPIIGAGSPDQFAVSFGVSRQFGIDF